MRGLGWLLLNRWRHLEAELAHYYPGEPPAHRIDDMRRLLVLVQGLPDGSYTWSQEGWTMERELLAANVELSHTMAGILIRLGGSKRRLKPLRIPRPKPKRPDGKKQTAYDRIRSYALRTMGKG